MLDDRPIKPDRQYLDAYIEKMSSQVDKKQFLRKKEQPLLPCHQHNEVNSQDALRKAGQNKGRKSKAEIYEDIKRKNRSRFGEKKQKQFIDEEQKKLDPKKMTINYKPKHSKANIDTAEYKKDKGTRQKSKKELEQKREDEQKVQYDKLLDYFQRQISEFEQEKEEFNKVATKLKFKEMIRQEQGLEFSKIKSQVQKHLISQNFSVKSGEKEEEKKQIQSEVKKEKIARQCQKDQKCKGAKNMSKTYSIGEIRSCMEKTTQNFQKIKQKLLNQQLSINQHRYDISQIYLLPQFEPETIFKYLDHNKLVYNQNDLYLQAVHAFNSKFQRENVEEGNMCQNQEEQHEHNPVKKDIKVKYIGEKRVMKYDEWTEVWIPGRQRLLTNKEGSKVIWLHNGDVLQQYPNQIKTYYSKVKQILKLQFKEFPPIYYHRASKQLWRMVDPNVRETVFYNGFKQVRQCKEHEQK